MENYFAPSKPAVDLSSLATPPSELLKSTFLSSSQSDLSPHLDTALQSPTSGESLAVSPVSPHRLPFAGGQYMLPLQLNTFDRKVDQPMQYHHSAFDDWMQWNDSAENVINPADTSSVAHFKMEPISPIMEALELSGGISVPQMSVAACNGLDDGSAAFQDSMLDGPLFPIPQEISSQQNGTFHMGQSSWSQPQPECRTNPSRNQYSNLPAQEALNSIRIALPTATTAKSRKAETQTRSQRNRKLSASSASSNSSAGFSRPPPRRHSAPKKTAHNMIEKRYRTNLNDKIAALRDSVPCLRIAENIPGTDAPLGEDLQGLDAAQKLNKATILSKATDYIAYLESRNEYLVKECQGLRERVDAFEVLLMSRSGSSSNIIAMDHVSRPSYHPPKMQYS